MSWTYKALKDYDEPPEWLVEERDRQRLLMQRHRNDMGSRARVLFADYIKKALPDEALPVSWPVFFAGWRVVADPVFGGLYRIRWSIRQLAAHGYRVIGNNTSERKKVRVMNPSGTPALDKSGHALYQYIRTPKVDTRMISEDPSVI